MADELTRLLPGRTGHFRLESGHHGDLWLDLNELFLRPTALRPFVADLASRLATRAVEVVCGPMTGGAFLGQMIAAVLDVEFVHADRISHQNAVTYRIPAGLREHVRGKRVGIVDDVINAGSAVRATAAEVRACGGTVVTIGALLVFGDVAGAFAKAEAIALESLARRPAGLWEPGACPLCAAGVPLEDATLHDAYPANS
jgi:orotate phosphoribosyltransferase